MENLLTECRFLEDPTNASPGRLVGNLLTYGERGQSRAERFRDNSIKWDEEGLLVNEMHDRFRPIVRVWPFQDGQTLKVDQLLPNTTAGRDAAENIRRGVLPCLSIEFDRKSVQSIQVGGVKEIRSARMTAIGLVDAGEYKSATAEVRWRETEGGVTVPRLETMWL